MSPVVTHCVLTLGFLAVFCSCSRYTADWYSLDRRPTPRWFDAAKFGIGIHWGVYSVPSFGKPLSELFWSNWKSAKLPSVVDFMDRHYKEGFSYQDFAPLFTAELFEPNKWADLFYSSGARYVVLTAKHVDGFAMWPSKYSRKWNSMDVGPRRDLVGELEAAVRRKGGMRFGVEYNMRDYKNTVFLADKKSGWTKTDFPRSKSTPQLMELVERYHPDIISCFGTSTAPYTYWNSTSFLAWLYNDSPVRSEVVVNNVWGEDGSGTHGDFLNCDPYCEEEKLKRFKWLKPLRTDKHSWGYRREAQISDYRTVTEIIDELVTTISRNGNLLLGVSATKDGIIPQIFQEKLLQVGKWLSVNGEAVYDSRPWKHSRDAANRNVWYTAKGNTVYVFVLRWPNDRVLYLKYLKVSSEGRITILGRDTERLQLSADLPSGTMISLPPLTPDQLPTPWALVLKVEGAL